jgi:hypothetical protein
MLLLTQEVAVLDKLMRECGDEAELRSLAQEARCSAALLIPG